jgi:uncharacterized protein YndB with AHSA1/START domain
MTNNFLFEPDMAAKKIHIACEFSAPIAKVWRAFTEPDLIVKWIAPKPWTAENKIGDFSVGGIWLYAMVGPEGQKHWTHVEFTAIDEGKSFSSTGMFSDENGTTTPGAPRSFRETKFTTIDSNKTKVEIEITFTDEATIKMFVEMGFKEGTMMSYSQLEEFLGNQN